MTPVDEPERARGEIRHGRPRVRRYPACRLDSLAKTTSICRPGRLVVVRQGPYAVVKRKECQVTCLIFALLAALFVRKFTAIVRRAGATLNTLLRQ